MTLANGTAIMLSKLKAGSFILSYNLQTHELQPSLVTGVYGFNATNRYIFNGLLNVDGTELMLINGKWERAYMAKVGDTLFDPITGQNITVTSINVSSSGGKVYDVLGSPVNNYIGDGFLIDKDSVTSDSAISVFGSGLLSMASGGTEPVSTAAVGQVVLGYNMQEQKIVPTIIVGVKKIVSNNKYVINGNLQVDSGEDLIVNRTNLLASQLKVGDKMFDPLTNQTIIVSSIAITYGNYTVYEIDTAPTDNFIDNGYLIS